MGQTVVESLLVELRARTAAFDRDITTSGRKVTDLASILKGAPFAAAGALGTALGALAVQGARAAASLDTEMRKVRVVTKGSAEEVRALQDGVLALYRTSSVGSLDELTGALQDIVGAGIEAGDALGFLTQATEASIAGATSVDVATNALLTITAAYRAQGITVQEASDKLFSTVDVGRLTFEQLAGSIGSVVPLAASYNISLEDLLGTVAQLTVNGLSVAESVTAIRSAIVNVISPSGKLAQIAPELAKEFNAAKLETDGFAKFLGDLYVAADGNKDILNALFSDVQGKVGVFSLLADEGEGVREKIAAIGGAAGATRTALGIMEEGAEATGRALKNEFNAQLIELGNRLLPTVNTAIAGATRLLDEFGASAATAGRRTQKALADMQRIQRGQTVPGIGGAAGGLAEDAILAAFQVSEGASLTGLSVDELRALRTAFERQREEGRGALKNLFRDMQQERGALLAGVDAELNRRVGTTNPMTTPTATAGGAPPKTPGTPTLTAEERKKLEAEAEKRQAALFKKASERATAIADQLASSQAAAAAFATDVQSQLARLTPSLVDDLTLALERLDEEARKTGQAADPAFQSLRTALAKQIEDTKALERLAPVLAETDALFASMERRESAAAADGGKPFTPTAADLAALNRQRATLRTIADDTTRSDEVRKAAAEALLRVEAAIAGARTTGISSTQRLAAGIKNAAQAAYGLATAFAGANSELTQMLGGIASAADGVGEISRLAQEAGGFSALFATGAGVASAMPALGAVVGGIGIIANTMFGETPADRARKQLQQENTQAIRDLTVRIGALNATSTGQRESRALTVASNTLRDSTATHFEGLDLNRELWAELAASGLTIEDLQEQAKRHGITINGMWKVTRQQLEDFLAAADSAGAAFERMQVRWRVLGTEQADQLKEFVAFVAGRVYPQLAGVLRGLDLETVAGRETAQQTVRDLFSGGRISAEVAEQFLQLLQGTGVDPRGGTGGYQIDRTITEVTGSRLDARLATANVWHERTATGIEALLAAVLGQPLPVLHAPSLPSSGGGAGRPAVAITVQVAAGAFVYTLAGDGRTRTGAEAAGQDLARGISQALQADVDLQRFLRGEEPS